MARYLLAGAVHRFAPPFFPYGTFVVNVTGCAVFGLLAGLANERGMIGVEGRAFLLIGVLGGYTTFSTLRIRNLRAAAHGARRRRAGQCVRTGDRRHHRSLGGHRPQPSAVIGGSRRQL